AIAMKMMERRKVDSLVVVDGQSHIEGYVSIYDVTSAFEDENKIVKDIIQPFGQVLSPDDSITDAVQILDKAGAAYVPVVDDDIKLLGLLTSGSVVGDVRDVDAQERWLSHVCIK